MARRGETDARGAPTAIVSEFGLVRSATPMPADWSSEEIEVTVAEYFAM
jgi:hypothetical protein